MSNFKIFGESAIGRIFTPNGLSYDKLQSFVLSPIHGRSIAIKVEEYKWILVKGGGWNYNGPQICMSNKDEELIFGIYPLISAKREYLVSKELEKLSDDFPKVLYYKKFSDYSLPSEYDFLKTIKFKNGNNVDPCLLYTMVKYPYRVADLAYLTKEQKYNLIAQCCKYWDIPISQYVDKFIQELAAHVGIMHKNQFINDTLEYSNVTLLGQIVDYEWVTAPNIELLDGTMGLELSDARREKELIYGAEVCLQLKAFLHQSYNFYEIYSQFVGEYKKYAPEFVENSFGVNKILKGEKIII